MTMTELMEADRLRPAEWDDWYVIPGNLTLSYRPTGYERYAVDLETCRTPAHMLDWIFQVEGKNWATPKVIAGLIRALDDITHPQSTLCPCGVPQAPRARTAIKKDVVAAAQRWPDRARRINDEMDEIDPATGVARPIPPELEHGSSTT